MAEAQSVIRATWRRKPEGILLEHLFKHYLGIVKCTCEVIRWQIFESKVTDVWTLESEKIVTVKEC
jgi:hypothetical protein